jgi:hypothetical protein
MVQGRDDGASLQRLADDEHLSRRLGRQYGSWAQFFFDSEPVLDDVSEVDEFL